MNDDQNKELYALVRWLQTFPEFGMSIYDGGECSDDALRLNNKLSTPEVSRGISKVAEAVCDLGQQNKIDTNAEQIWTSLLIVTSTKARPLPKEPRRDGKDNRITPARLKMYVLSNLLDCAVQTQDLQKRRLYIERIMGLSKPTQKTLMSLIERRGPKRTTSSTHTAADPNLSSPQASQSVLSSPMASSRLTGGQDNSFPKSPQSTNRIHSYSETPSRNQRNSQYDQSSIISSPSSRLPSKSSSSQQIQNASNSLFAPEPDRRLEPPPDVNKDIRDDYEDDIETNASSTTECRSNTSSIRPRSIIRYPDKASRLFSSAFSPKSCSGFTPDQKRCFAARPMFEDDDKSSFLSPGTMDSPTQLTELVHDLRVKNEEYRHMIEGLKQREAELAKRLDESEAEHRRKLMKVESKGLDRIQEIQQESEEKIESLQKELEQSRERALEGLSAIHELKLARDEIEVLSHSKDALADTTEKLRKYKDKVSELQDMKDVLNREQDAHAKTMEDVIRLENELRSMQPLKRQLEDYRFRAVEAEVKLVECQDYLRKLELHAGDQAETNSYLRNGVMMQKEQLEELHRRIQEETSSIKNDDFRNTGVGDGISELNPDLNQELIRLRSENLQLRAFAAKREADAVQHLEESLEDSKRLADRYKHEFLGIKETLHETKSMLDESRRNEASLRTEVTELTHRAQEAEQNCEELDQQLATCEKELDKLQAELQKANEEIATLKQDVNKWKKKVHDAEKISNDRMERLKNVLGDLEETTNTLRNTELQVHELRDEARNWEKQASKNGTQLQQIKRRSQQVKEELDDTLIKLDIVEKKNKTLESQINKLNSEKSNFQEQLKIERKLRQEEIDEAQRSLDATRQVLEAKQKKELEELQSNMNRLLEDERQSMREKAEEAKRKQNDVQNEWNFKMEELKKNSAMALTQAKEAAKEAEERLKQELEEKIAKERKENSEAHERLIRKGKAMLEEAKTKAENEIRRLDSLIRELEEKNERLDQEKTENSNVFNSKISSLKQKLEFLTSQLNNISQENDELQEKIKCLEREKFKMQEDNDRFRRQLGGRFGADGKVQSTLENLQREYNTLLEENRKLKIEAKEGIDSGAFFDSMLHDGNESEYRRGKGVDGTALRQLRQEYEETIESLNDEKRELIMRNSAAITDVQRAEQRAWEREQEVSKLKAEITSLNLDLQREKISREVENEADTDSFAGGKKQVEFTPPRATKAYGNKSVTRSPGLERAYHQKVTQENQLRSRFSSLLTGNPRNFNSSEAKNELSTSTATRQEQMRETQKINTNIQLLKPTTTQSSDFEVSDDSKNSYSLYEESQNESATIAMNVSIVDSKPIEASLGSSSIRNEARWTSYTRQVDLHNRASSDDSDTLQTNSTLSSNSSESNSTDRDKNSIQGDKVIEHLIPSLDSTTTGGPTSTQAEQENSSQQSSGTDDVIPGNSKPNKYEGRFDRWINFNTINESQNQKFTDVQHSRKSNAEQMQKESTDNASSPSPDKESDKKKNVRRKSANFQKAASVFEAAANKATASSPDPIKSPAQKVSSIKKRIELAGSKIEPSNEGVLSISKRFEQHQHGTKSVMNGSDHSSEGVLSISKKFEQHANRTHPSNSSAFKMASAVFQVGGADKSKTEFKSQYSKSPYKGSNEQQSNAIESSVHSTHFSAQSMPKLKDSEAKTPKNFQSTPNIAQVTQMNQFQNNNEGGSECKQS